ncbi:MAG: transporter substrate-binding domain-containing protein [Lachnospiraceae bacterium]|nr:transporter substrate-binding domain-containing protein [Lachnospiraceae bacterium]
MKKRVMSVIMAAIFATGMLGGCGSSSSTTSTASTAASSAAASTAASSATTSTEEAASGASSTASGDFQYKDALKGVSLKVGTSGLFGPFSYYDSDGKTLIGYDIDLLQDLSDLLGFEIDGGIQAQDYSSLTTSLSEGKLDVGAAALCATDERKEVMNFSPIYCDSGQVVMINSDNDEGITGVDDLAGKKVAVEKGTASHTYASKNLPDSTLEVHDTITTAYESLEQGKVDAVIQDGPGAAFYIKTTPDSKLKIVGDEFNQGQAPYCVAISKDCEYYDQISAAVQYLIDNGTTDELYKKWCE